MNGDRPPAGSGADRLLVSLRKAALLSHWVPELGVRVVQRFGPDIRVTPTGMATSPRAWPGGLQFSPCEFRHLVAHLWRGGDADGSNPIRIGGRNEIHLHLFTGTETQLGGHGLVRFSPIPGALVFAVPTVAAADQDLPVANRRTPSENEVEVSIDHDALLEASLVHLTFAETDEAGEQAAHAVIVEVAARFAAAEVAKTLEAMPLLH